MPSAETLKRVFAYPALLGALMAGGCLAEPADGQVENSANPQAANLPNKLVFASNRSGNYQIYLKNLVTKKLINLSDNKSNDMNAQPSPDGKQLVFYSDRTGNNQIYELNLANPQNVQLLTHDGANDYDPVFTPDGNHILYKSDLKGVKGLGDIWIMDKDGSNPRDLTPKRAGQEDWKPEPAGNDKIIFTSSQGSARANPNTNELYTLNINTGTTQRLTKNKVPDWFPAYSTVNSKVAFISKANVGASDAIYMMDPNGKNRAKITHQAGDSDDPSWSADGKHLTYVNNASGNYNIYVIDKDGSERTILDVNPKGNDLSPMFLP